MRSLVRRNKELTDANARLQAKVRSLKQKNADLARDLEAWRQRASGLLQDQAWHGALQERYQQAAQHVQALSIVNKDLLAMLRQGGSVEAERNRLFRENAALRSENLELIRGAGADAPRRGSGAAPGARPPAFPAAPADLAADAGDSDGPPDAYRARAADPDLCYDSAMPAYHSSGSDESVAEPKPASAHVARRKTPARPAAMRQTYALATRGGRQRGRGAPKGDCSHILDIPCPWKV